MRTQQQTAIVTLHIPLVDTYIPPKGAPPVLEAVIEAVRTGLLWKDWLDQERKVECQITLLVEEIR